MLSVCPWFCTELPYGDQALFMSRQKFDAIGGFPDWPLMEDYELVSMKWKTREQNFQ